MKGFAEIERTVGEGAGLERNPNGLCQIGADFDLNGEIVYVGDVESKLIVGDAKTAVIGLNLWVPQHRRKTGKNGTPTASARQIIHRRVSIENIWRKGNGRGVARKINAREGALRKRRRCDAGDAAGNRDAGQSGAASVRDIGDGGDRQPGNGGWDGH